MPTVYSGCYSSELGLGGTAAVPILLRMRFWATGGDTALTDNSRNRDRDA
jgi:hypothetical protein